MKELFIVALIVCAGIIYYNWQRFDATEIDQRRELAAGLASARQQVRALSEDVSTKRSQLQTDRVLARHDRPFKTLRALHHESHQAGNAWYRSLKSAQDTRDGFRFEIDNLKSARRLHARGRSQSQGAARLAHVQSGRQVTSSIDSLYGALDELNAEIRAMREQLDSYNIQTARLRDYIGQNCGAPGREWHRALMARRNAQQLAPPKNY